MRNFEVMFDKLNRLTYLNYVLMEVCAIGKETLGCFRTVSFLIVAVVLEQVVLVEEFK